MPFWFLCWPLALTEAAMDAWISTYSQYEYERAVRVFGLE